MASSRLRRTSTVGGYGVGGIGYYHWTVQLTSPAVGYARSAIRIGTGAIRRRCRLTTPVDRSQDNFGINFGGGLTFGGETAKFYVEFRYHYVWGSEVRQQVTVPGGPCEQGCSTNAQSLRITFGVRW